MVFDSSIEQDQFGRDTPDPAEAVHKRTALTAFDLPLAPAGTEYRRKVWHALTLIPYGATRTYGELAAIAGGSARSVGQANGRNPIPIVIPCHRVLASTDLGGYSGGDGLETKRWLLAHEGAALL